MDAYTEQLDTANTWVGVSKKYNTQGHLGRVLKNPLLFSELLFVEKNNFLKLPPETKNRVKNILKHPGNLTDPQIYNKIAHVTGPFAQKSEDPVYEAKRANNRASEIKNFLDNFHYQPKRILDVGCANGIITASLGKLYHLEPTNVQGYDVINVSPVEGMTFTKINPGSDLPYQNDSFDLITALMVLHHIPDIPDVLAELYRVLKPGGIFLIREHDVDSQETADIIETVHGFYSFIWKSLVWKEDKVNFFGDYHSNYMSKQALDQIIIKAGFKPIAKMYRGWVKQKNKINPCTIMRCYYQCYTK